MELNETAQYFTRPKYPSSGFLYERTFDLTNKGSMSTDLLIDMIGYNELSIEVQTIGATGANITITPKQGNGKDTSIHTAVGSALVLSSANANDSDHTLSGKAAYLSLAISGTIPDVGKLHIRVCGSR